MKKWFPSIRGRVTKPDLKAEISVNHYKMENYTERMTTAQWKAILLAYRDSVVFKGCVRRLVAKRLGAGVVEVSKAPAEE